MGMMDCSAAHRERRAAETLVSPPPPPSSPLARGTGGGAHCSSGYLIRSCLRFMCPELYPNLIILFLALKDVSLSLPLRLFHSLLFHTPQPLRGHTP
jgi:hypothetical protein